MNTSENDDANASTDTSTSDSPEGAESTETSESQDEEQSSKDTQAQAPKTYRVGGRDLSADELFDKHVALEKDYSRKSNKLSELEKSRETGATTEGPAKALKDLPPDVKATLDAYSEAFVLPRVRQEFAQKSRADELRSSREKAFDELTKEWDGTDGKPKFEPSDKEEVLNKMSEPGAMVFDPRVIWERAHQAEITDWQVKQALKSQKGRPVTGRTGSTEPKPQGNKPVKSFKEAGKRLQARLAQAAEAI